jgi:hypothetical protein
VKEINGKEYISRTVLLIRAKISSMQSRNTHAVIKRLEVLKGLLVAIRSPAKKDWAIPTYSIGSMNSMSTTNFSKISKRKKNILLLI